MTTNEKLQKNDINTYGYAYEDVRAHLSAEMQQAADAALEELFGIEEHALIQAIFDQYAAMKSVASGDREMQLADRDILDKQDILLAGE